MGQRSEHVKRRRHTPEQIVRKLREADRLLAEGTEVPEVAKALEISEATYHRWRAQYGGMKADDVKRLKELEQENARLKRIVADQVLEVAALKEVAKGRMILLRMKFKGAWTISLRFGMVLVVRVTVS
jgi:putative transposase